VVLATHEWEAARQVADDAVVMVGGRVIHQGPAAALTRADLPVLYTGGRS
jgi:ABC-type branched-subunit amino acid transport system ATPase component